MTRQVCAKIDLYENLLQFVLWNLLMILEDVGATMLSRLLQTASRSELRFSSYVVFRRQEVEIEGVRF